jgi:hypothetical protein
MAFSFSQIAEANGSDVARDMAGSDPIGAGGEGCGFRTDRLSSRQLRTWRKIEGIVFARDAAGQHLHPTLERLWRQAESSGIPIFIELRPSTGTDRAGRVVVEGAGPDRDSRALAIHLHTSTIDRADTSKWARRPDGFIPFQGLNREQRYAEVLGHELVHALQVLQDPDYAALAEEQVRLYAESAACSREAGKVVYSGENERRMRRLAILDQLAERSALEAEIAIWRELKGTSP